MTALIATQLSTSRRSSRSRSSSSTSVSHHGRTRLLQILGVALTLSLVINLFIAITLGSYVRKSSLLSSASSNLRLQIADITQQVELKAGEIVTLKNEIEELTLNRLPGLTSLSYDEVIKVDKQYVKNIVFTRIGKKGARLYEYKVVLENHQSPLQPALKILLFDRSGVQVGMSELSNDSDHGSITRLDQDEVRAHYAVVQLPEASDPEYFQIILL